MSVDESMRDTTMARTAKHDATHALVDVKQGLVSRELFVNEELYQQEQEQLFAHCWLFASHRRRGSRGHQLPRR